MQINKSDRNDAVGIARIMQCGWYKEVRVKDLDSHAVKALLVSRALLVKIKRDLENQIRGLLKNLGLVIGPAKMNAFALRAAELTEDRPELAAAVTPLLHARVAIAQQIADLDREGVRVAVSERSAYDLFLTRNLKKAQLVRAKGIPASYDAFIAQKLEALGGLKPKLVEEQARTPGSRVLDGQITGVQQAIGAPKGRGAASKYLREFAEDVKRSGLVARIIEKHGVKGVRVAQ